MWIPRLLSINSECATAINLLCGVHNSPAMNLPIMYFAIPTFHAEIVMKTRIISTHSHNSTAAGVVFFSIVWFAVRFVDGESKIWRRTFGRIWEQINCHFKNVSRYTGRLPEPAYNVCYKGTATIIRSWKPCCQRFEQTLFLLNKTFVKCIREITYRIHRLNVTCFPGVLTNGPREL